MGQVWTDFGIQVTLMNDEYLEVGPTSHRWLFLQATFKITLDVPLELVALSNMPIAEEKIDGNIKTVSYQESPIMSTYLVAVVVGLFDYVEDHTPDGKMMSAMYILCIDLIISTAFPFLLN